MKPRTILLLLILGAVIVAGGMLFSNAWEARQKRKAQALEAEKAEKAANAKAEAENLQRMIKLVAPPPPPPEDALKHAFDRPKK